jgi:hypothetical protein
MVPFYFPQPLLKSRVMKKHSSPAEARTLKASDISEAWISALGTFALSSLLTFLIQIKEFQAI